jgi:hypothetical protein
LRRLAALPVTGATACLGDGIAGQEPNLRSARSPLKNAQTANKINYAFLAHFREEKRGLRECTCENCTELLVALANESKLKRFNFNRQCIVHVAKDFKSGDEVD